MSDAQQSQIAAAICAVMKEVKFVKATGYNGFHKFTYASDEDILLDVRPSMARNGLSLIPSGTTYDYSPSNNEKEGDRVTVTVTYTLLHTSGESQVVVGIGCGCDKGDKAVYKALTGARKALLTSLFLLPRLDDPEAFGFGGKDEDEAAPKGKGQSSAPEAGAWSDEERAFFMGALDRLGLNYDDVAAWVEVKGQPRPSALGEARRKKLIEALTTKAVQDDIAVLAAGREAAA